VATEFQFGGRTIARAIAAGIVAGLIAGGIAFAVSQELPKGYTAESQVLVGALTTTNTDQLDAYHRLSLTYAQLATSSPLLERVQGQLGLNVAPGELASRVDAQANSQGIIAIDATASSPDEASRISNAIAAEILALATAPGQPTSLAEVIQPAVPPDHASTPNVTVNTLVAAFLGFFLGLGGTLLVASRRSPARAPGAQEAQTVAWPERS
jgi:capsular polysaccharide biosynthesis protein